MKLYAAILVLLVLFSANAMATSNYIAVKQGSQSTINSGESTTLIYYSQGLSGNHRHYVEILLRDSDTNEIVDTLFSSQSSELTVTGSLEIFADDYYSSDYYAIIYTSVDIPFTNDPADMDSQKSSILLTVISDPDPVDLEFTNIYVNANPSNGIDSLTAELTCTAYGGDSPISYAWDYENDGTIDSYGPSATHTYSVGVFNARCTAYDINGDVITGLSNDITVSTVPQNIPPIAEFSMTPNRVYEDEEVTFDASASTDEDGSIVSYEWDFDQDEDIDMTGVVFKKSFAPGNYPITLKVTDNQGATASKTRILVVDDELNLAPTAIIKIYDNPSFVNEVVIFDASASSDPENDLLTYSWFIDGIKVSNQISFEKTFSNEGAYDVSLVVTDEENSAKDSEKLIINKIPVSNLEITKINCFDKIIVNNEQVCEVYVEENGIKSSNALIELYKLNGDYLGTCNTNTLSGGCNIKFQENTLGSQTVYAIASKQGFTGDDDTYPRYTYEVLQETFKIINLNVYEDKDYTIEQDTFFRGEDLYVSFEVLDALGNIINPSQVQITKATLVSMPGGRVDLEKDFSNNNKYYYKLRQIPLTHDFFSDSQVFTFAFDFSNGGGQATADLTILNNPPRTMGIPNQKLMEGNLISLNLDQYFLDLEEDILTYELVYTYEDIVTAYITSNQLVISAENEGSTTLSIIAKDYDGDTVKTSFNVLVKTEALENQKPKAVISIVPNPALIGQTVTFDGTKSNDPEGDSLTYEWYVEGILASEEAVWTRVFNTAQSIDVKLIVSDDELSDEANEVLIIYAPQNLPPTAKISGPQTTNKNNEVTYDASASTDPENGILYYIWKIAGNVVKQGFESFLTWVFDTPGTYEVSVEVQDDVGQTDIASINTQVIKETIPEPMPEEKSRDVSFQKITLFGHAPDRVKAGDYLQVRVGTYSDNVDDIYPSLIIPELGIKAKGQRSDINGKDALQASIFIPGSTPEGYYMIRIGLSGDEGVRKGEYRWFKVEK